MSDSGKRVTLLQVSELLTRVRERKPLIHHITNYVTANDCANITLSMGGLPIMADALEEVEEMVEFSGALILNLGTINQGQIEAMIKAGQEANQLGVPVLLDPVGAGATDFRTESTKKILNEVKVSVLKGNFAEIGLLAGGEERIRGINAEEAVDAIKEVAQEFAAKEEITVVATGVTDLVTNGELVLKVDNGHYLMSTITGTGCMAGSVLGCFLAVEEDSLIAAGAGLISYGIAGQIASRKPSVDGPASFKTAFFDSLYNLSEESVVELGKYSIK